MHFLPNKHATDALSRTPVSAVILIVLGLSLMAANARAQVAQSSFTLPPNQWAQLVIPGTPPSGSNTVAAVLGSALNTNSYQQQWVLYGFQPDTASYQTIPLSSPLEPGRGYWLIHITDNPVTISLPANTVEPVGTQNSTGDYVITIDVADESLPPSSVGWSMIGKPGTMASLVSDLHITTQAQGSCHVSSPCSFEEAVDGQYVSDTLYAYNASTGEYDEYVQSDGLPDWQGLWLGTQTALADIDGVAVQFPALAPSTNSFDDEFNSNSLAQWEQRYVAENTAPQFTLLDINNSAPGALAIEPTRTPGWFADGDAPLLSKLVSGNFSVETFVSTESTSTPGGPPNANFNSAGLIARNPSGATQSENYIMVNVGQQNGVAGSETKTTVNSSSVLDIIPGSIAGRLILCRIGSTFHAYRWLDNENSWSAIGSYPRPDLPNTLQVGMVVSAFTGPDLRAEFDYIRLRIPGQLSQCTGS